MVCTQEKDSLLGEFSEQVRRHFPAAVWRSLFLDRTGRAEFGSTVRTVLCIECPSSGPLKRDGLLAALNRTAPLHAGRVDPCTGDFAFVSFADPACGLRMAMALQRQLPRARLRMGLATGRCRMAVCSVEGHDFLMLLGQERARVESLTERAAAGTVQLAPETYDLLQNQISHDLGSCVVLAEFDDDVLTEVSLTLPPDPAAEASTFAGLGLT